ncbi:hypothetical protein [Priestia koreensis]|uniref:Uncharacterized protein n=1 Tax=Priestia koreensis TaxID=284581 RepID=A0A0M0KZP8_9BACI|nr:hypothetical protein [Priestia koreensis]KOO44291.1 hypothetical protein AMD01_13480 [Priestia koreensis]
MHILANRKGLQHGQKTGPITINYGFMKALFNIELSYDSGESFSITKNSSETEGRYRKLHHLVRADFYAAMLLQAVCHATTYDINNVNYASLYDALCMWYEDPISFYEFVISLKKFEQLGLITLVNRKENGRFDIQLRILEEDTYFIVSSPVVFTKGFTDLSLSHWKLFFAALLQTGTGKEKVLFRQFDNEQHDNMMHKGLKQFLHKHQASDVKRLIEELITIPVYNEKPLFIRPKEQLTYKYEGRKLSVAYFSVHPSWILSHKKGQKYHFPIQPVVKFSRFAWFIQHELEQLGLTEHFTNNIPLVNELISTLKPKGKVLSRHVLHKIREYIREQHVLPTSLTAFIQNVSRSRMKATIENLARTEGVHQWIAPHMNGEVKEQRTEAFVSRMSYFATPTLRKLFKKGYTYLQRYYTRLALYTSNDYKHVQEFDHMPMMKEIRKTAARKKVCPAAYAALEKEALEMWEANPDWERWQVTNELGKWLLDQLEHLPSQDTMAVLPPGVQLEDILLSFS